MFKHLGKSTQIFAHAFYEGYGSPSEFEFDIYNSNPMLFITDKKLSTYNADEMTYKFLDLVNHWKTHYKTNHILIPMGGDFTYTDAKMNFESMDSLINFI